jgi:soluble lytic murein transglycosylase
MLGRVPMLARAPLPARAPLLTLAAVLVATQPARSEQSQSAAFLDSAVAAARRAIDRDRPWQATRALAPLVRDSATRRPDVLLTAARAAARWEGWGEVVGLLARVRWLDTLAGGEGRALLARAFLERAEPAPAVTHARRAVALARDTSRGARLVTLARALDRAGELDSAAVHYLAAAAQLPAVAEWLRLRAAGVLADSTRRAELYSRVEDPVATARIPWTEALAWERRGDRLAAAARYEALGARMAAVRLRLAAGDSAVRRAARRELNDLLATGAMLEDAPAAIALFDREFPSKSPVEELRIARRAAAANLLERAALGFARAGMARLTDRDRFSHATVLSRLGRYQEALPLFESVRSPELRGEAAYLRARAILRSGRVEPALLALGQVAEQFARDSNPASTALFLTADLVADRGGDDSARALFARAATQYPTTRSGRRAGFQAALIAYLNGDHAAAAAEFDQLDPGAIGNGNGEEAIAGLYWAGRALERAGDTAGARKRWDLLIGRDPDSYYAVLARRRIGATRPPIPLSPETDSSAATPAGLIRAEVLGRLGLRVEAEFELNGYAAGAGSSPTGLLARSRALRDAAHYGRGVRVALRAQERGARWDRALAELLYPLPFGDVLAGEARSPGVDPLLMASLIRQESAFEVEARSVADARGLMQVLPAVGEASVRRLGISDFDPALLYQPDLNLDLGIAHFAAALGRFGVVEQALAAYNAGVDRVERWLTIRGVEQDPEVFVERIPFTETRDYVRRVLRNYSIYRALYGPTVP